ncbi:hypothetical protein ASD12_31155 [Mesorhizobium sp. Root102]|uniref:helix-turn-helix domain-containing protein n=1 Tax=Mesorhizobium sp. Root102 TaxID=1736422 RepID=UPI0007126248|nr:XRE family transcriptional regulator [Mesorhizobium sp. Root102]KQU85859.1 hypothetical protein ASD12_31155 [Mesorhizobium sp. Root102]
MKNASKRAGAESASQWKPAADGESKKIVRLTGERGESSLMTGLYDQQKAPGKAFDLSARLRSLRKQHSITLEELARRSGLVRSTLSKMENGRMSPTFEVLLKLASGFGMELAELLKPQAFPAPTGRFAVTEGADADQIEYPNYILVPHASNLKSKRMLPFISRMTARSLEEFDDWNRHETEDFMLVLSGQMIFYSDTYEPIVLNPGDSIYFDGRMGHACISGGDTICEAVYVCTQE